MEKNFVRLSGILIPTIIALALGTWSVAASGRIDSSFGVGGRVIFSPTEGYDTVRRLRIQPDGKIVTFGGGTVYGLSSFILRHHPDGQFDAGFGSGGVLIVPGTEGRYFNDLAVLANGHILLAGSVDNNFSESATGFATFSSNGTLVPAISASAWDDAPAEKLLIQADGKVIVVAPHREQKAFSELVAIRYSENAEQLDVTFGLQSLASTRIPVFREIEFWSNYGSSFIGDAAIQPNGSVLMCGSGISGTKVARITSSGNVDVFFGMSGVVRLPDQVSYAHPAGLLVQPDGKIVVNGVVAEFGITSSFLARLNPNGSPDPDFGVGGIVTISETDPNSRGIAAALTLQKDGKIITAGERTGGFALMRLNSNGSVDTSFGNDGVLATQMGSSTRAAILSLAWQPDGKLVAAGSVGDPANPTDVGLVRYIFDASPVTVSGRVVTPTGIPLRNTRVDIIDSLGTRRSATTGSFGLFTFDNVTTGGTFTISISSKRYRFAVRTIQPTGDLTLDDFVGLE